MSTGSALVHVISSLGAGGAEAMLDKLTARLPREGAAVVCLTGDGPIGERIAARGVPVTSLRLGQGGLGLSALLRLFRDLRRQRPRIVQTWLYHGDLIGGLVARAAGVRHVVWNVRNSGAALDRLPARTRAIVHLNAWLSHWIPQRILCCSETARRNHIALGFAADKFVVIPNGFDIDRFAPSADARASVRRELGVREDCPLVGLVARFDPQKNHRGFIAAARDIHRLRPDVAFLLVGRGIDAANKSLAGWIGEAGIAGCVHLLGQRTDIARITAALDVAANASLAESFPNTVGEAMACGVPCVVTDVGDSADIVGPTGRSVPAHDMTALAQQVLELLALPVGEREKLGQAARRRVAELYEIDSVVARYRDFYADLLRRESR
ncbi:MAG: glycosyltransferase [Piscinibacter sp.]|nr:glycosyltransferase [Piscinibacter sp.]